MLLKSIAFILYLYQSIQISQGENKFTRLPRNVEPIRYSIDVKPYFDEKHSENKNFTFDGYTSIEFKVLEETNSITFHYCNLTINQSSLHVNEFSSKRNINVINQVMNSTLNFYTVIFDETLLKDHIYIVSIEYSANLTDSLTGFYRSHYVDKNNVTRWLAVTYFEETHAREAFPCFDEPDLKAIFDIRVRRLPNYKSLSNMPIEQTISDMSDTDGRVIDIYKTSNKMSTYLVAFVVTDYNCITNDFGNHSICTMDKDIGSVKNNLEIAESLLLATEQYLKTDYPLPKLDHVVIPQFFSLGMENWGLITYGEKHFIHHPEDNEVHLNKVSLTISHEIAHQWFGDLVTCEWWTYMWLNEGFATYMQFRALELVKPDWRVDEQFTVESLISALAVDGPNSPKLETDDPEFKMTAQIVAVAYAKGAAIIRMMEHVLTPSIFRTGIINYLTEMSSKSANDDDLWRNLQKALDEHQGTKPNLGGLTVGQIAKTWTRKSGYPLVTVERINSTTLKLSQTVFIESEDDVNITETGNNTIEEETTDWWIPINYATRKNPDFSDTTAQYWLGKEPVYIECDESDWIVINKNRTGYYRVFYDETSWINIQNALIKNNEEIPPVDRALLFADTLDYYERKGLDYLLNVSRFLENETDYIPWNIGHNVFTIIYVNVQMDKPVLQLFLEYFHRIVSKVYENVNGFEEKESDDHLTKMKRYYVLDIACKTQYKKCVDDGRKKFNDFQTGKITTLSSNIASSVYCVGLTNSTEEEWTSFFNKLNTTANKKQRKLILDALTCSDNENILNRYLLYLLTNGIESLTQTELNSALMGLTEKRNIRTDVSREFFISNLEIFRKGFQTSTRNNFAQGIYICTGSIKQTQEINKILMENKNSSTEAVKEMILPILQTSSYSSLSNKTKEYLGSIRKWLEIEKQRVKKISKEEELNVKMNEIEVDEYFSPKVDVMLSESSFVSQEIQYVRTSKMKL